MKTITVVMTAMALAMLSQLSMAECVKGEKPQIPDGASATLEEMVAGQKAVKEYMAVGNAYLECLDGGAPAEGVEEEPEAAQARIDDYNSVVEEQEGVAAAWSEALKAYKAQEQ